HEGQGVVRLTVVRLERDRLLVVLERGVAVEADVELGVREPAISLSELGIEPERLLVELASARLVAVRLVGGEGEVEALGERRGGGRILGPGLGARELGQAAGALLLEREALRIDGGARCARGRRLVPDRRAGGGRGV